MVSHVSQNTGFLTQRRTERAAKGIIICIMLGLLIIAVRAAIEQPWYPSRVVAALIGQPVYPPLLVAIVLSLIGLAVASLAGVLYWGGIELKIGLSLTVLSIPSGLYSLEVVLSVIDQPDSPATRAGQHGVAFDQRSPLAVLKDMRAENEAAYPYARPVSFNLTSGLENAPDALFPLAGLSHTATLLCNESGYHVVYRSDQHGFRNPSPEWPSHADVVLLGDSFAHGLCVAEGQDIAGRLRQRGHVVMNLGMSGYGPLFTLATLREYASLLQPRLVVWLYYEGNDLENLLTELRFPTLHRYLNDTTFTQALKDRQDSIDSLLKRHLDPHLDRLLANAPQARSGPVFLSPYRWTERWARWKQVLKLQHLRQRIKTGVELSLGGIREPHPAFHTILTQAQQLVASWGGTLVFVYLPEYYRFSGHKRHLHRPAVLTITQQLRIPTIDLVPIFEQTGDPLSLFPFRAFGHYTAEGYALVAKELDAYRTLHNSQRVR